MTEETKADDTEGMDTTSKAAVAAAAEAKKVLIRHAEALADKKETPAMVVLATLELMGAALAAGHSDPKIGKGTLGLFDLYLPPMMNALRKAVDEAEANPVTDEEKAARAKQKEYLAAEMAKREEPHGEDGGE